MDVNDNVIGHVYNFYRNIILCLNRLLHDGLSNTQIHYCLT